MGKAVVGEKKFGRFATLAEGISDWVDENGEEKTVVGGRYTIVPNKEKRNQHHRGATLVYASKEEEEIEG